MSVHKKLMDARIRLQGMQLKKSGKNRFAGYEYFELGDFLPSIQVIFTELGLSGFVSFGAELATLTITDIDGGGQILITSPMSEAALKGCHAVQNLGAVQTYLRRYLWVSAMEIVEHDALDATTGKDSKIGKDSRPHPASGAGIKLEAYESLDAEGRAWIDNLAVEVVDILAKDGADQANAYIRTLLDPMNTDLEWKNALWSRLDSKTRTALKQNKETT